MRIIKCNITNFGCYSNKTFNFNSNLNSFCLNNGSGKTTLAAFIKAMLYSLEKSSIKSYERKHYKPYSGGEYGGAIEIELNGKIYRIERTFGDSPTKDTLKIYDENGVSVTSFLSNSVSSLQGEASAKLGELILGIDCLSFQKCNFISSKDLDFSSSESIKMKIGNIVIDKERENSYEDTYDLISLFDLREKAPTRKNENAYPFKIKELEKSNKEKQDEINELNSLNENLKNLYNERDLIKSELNEIEQKQKKFSYINVLKGKLDVVNKYDSDINVQNKKIDSINEKYNYNLPTPKEIDAVDSYVKEYENYNTVGLTYKIAQSDIIRLQQLEGRVMSDDDYSKLADAFSKIKGNVIKNGIVDVDLDRYEALKLKFDGKIINDRIDKDYYEYDSLINQKNNYNIDVINYPNADEINYIDDKINEYNDLNIKLRDKKTSYNKGSFIVKLFLIIITFGFYFIVLNSKKKNHLYDVKELEGKINSIKNELDSFFLKYNLEIGTYEIKMIELKRQITKYNEIKNNLKQLLDNIDSKGKSLYTYFSSFGYDNLDINQMYNLYKKELYEYNSLLSDVRRNDQINHSIEENKKEQNNIIDSILSKYNLTKLEDFSSQLNKLKADLEFYKSFNPIYINKKENDEQKKIYEKRIISILNSHNIDVTDDVILCAKNVSNDVKEYNDSNKNKIELIDNKNKFINENDLNGFIVENIDSDEEKLRTLREETAIKLKTKEDEIAQNETNIARIDLLLDEICENNELISNYKDKIEVAKLALKALSSAHLDMEAKYIAPIKNSFISYAKKIYEKIGSNVSMNYDYEIKYDVNGQLRDAKDLSDGERTIMMLALRFSVLDSMYKNHDSVIILDDPFDSLDSIKLKKAVNLIKELANDWQIVYFTCHNSRMIE